MTHLRLGTCTYRRPEGLRALFSSFDELIVPEGVRFDIVVVDNDSEPSSRDLVDELSQHIRWDCFYVHEPNPGIPSARNRVLAEAQNADFLLFVDDDETVTPNLLVEHLKIQRKTQADFVQGPCKMVVEDPADNWWLESIFFSQRTFEDGASRKESWTNNVLINMHKLSETGVTFDEKLRFSGGSDTLFFQDFVRRGATGAYAAYAEVQEVQPTSRLTWKWALNRQYRYGVTRANTMVLREKRSFAVVKCTLTSMAMVAVGLMHFLTSLALGKRGLANAGAFFARAAGVFLGSFGFRAEEYARK